VCGPVSVNLRLDFLIRCVAANTSSARQLNPGRCPTYRSGNPVQITGTTSKRGRIRNYSRARIRSYRKGRIRSKHACIRNCSRARIRNCRLVRDRNYMRVRNRNRVKPMRCRLLRQPQTPQDPSPIRRIPNRDNPNRHCNPKHDTRFKPAMSGWLKDRVS
jgi:hypothetical protein